MGIFSVKSLETLFAETEGNKELKRSLSAVSLVLLGVGALIGAGLFVRTAAATGSAGNGVVISFVIAAIACAFAGLCYAEFSTAIPVSGSAYSYANYSLGEIVAWIIGWALILEYALGAATVSIGWSEYLNQFLIDFFNVSLPYEWSHSPFQSYTDAAGVQHFGNFNAIAFIVVFLITLLLIKGIEESAFINGIIVIVKVCIVILIIVLGWQFIQPENYVPFLIPDNQPPIYGHDFSSWRNHGVTGIFGGAAIVFFAFIGFDAVSTAAQETKNPKRDMPIGILGSLFICTILYVLFAYVITGLVNWEDFLNPKLGKEASIAYAINTGMPAKFAWLSKTVTIAILFGFTSVILVMLMGQSRVFYAMSKDGLMPKLFSDIHPKYRTPYKSNIILFIFVSLIAGFVPADKTGDLTSFGTLLAFMIVCAGVWILRVKNPGLNRPFRTPLVPFVSTMGVLVCGFLIFSIDAFTLEMSLLWMVLGLVFYFSYGYHKKFEIKNAIIPLIVFIALVCLYIFVLRDFIKNENPKIENIDMHKNTNTEK